MSGFASKNIRMVAAWTWVVFFFLHTGMLCCQAPVNAPIPLALTSAKTIFLGNAGAEANGISERAYSVLYTGLASWNHYQLTPEPASADIILELRYTAPTGETHVFKGDSLGTSFLPRFQLVVLDRATHTILWSLTEFPFGTRKQKFEETNDNAINALVGDLKSLSAGKMPSVSEVHPEEE